MVITFYKSSLCPRCALAGKRIEALRKEFGFEVEKVDVLINPLRAFNDGVRWIPAVKIKDSIFYGKKLKTRNLQNLLNNKN